MKRKNEEITFKDILSIFIPKIWLIAIVSVVCAVAMYTYSAFMVDDTYTASSVMHVRKDSDTLNITDISTTESVIEVISYRVYSDDFLSVIIANVNKDYDNAYLNLTPAQIRGAIKYSPLGNGMLRLTVTTSNIQLTYAIAQALETNVPIEFVTYQKAFGVFIYDNAERPTAPNGKNTVRNALIGFVGGAVVSAVAVWIYSMLDSVIRDKKKIEDYFDLAVIGTIPACNTNENKDTEVH